MEIVKDFIIKVNKKSDSFGMHHENAKLTRFVSCVSIMKLCTCFSARVSSNFLDTTATSNAVQPAPYKIHFLLKTKEFLAPYK